MKIRFMEEAENDLQAGQDFYNAIQPTIGDWFIQRLIEDIEGLSVTAGVRYKEFGLFRLLAKRFPYVIYYSFKQEAITVVAVLPLKRDPEWISAQLYKRQFVLNLNRTS